jgi:hypothetical protein
LEHEILRESLGIPLHLLVETTRQDAVEFRQIPLKHDLFAANGIDAGDNALVGYGGDGGVHGGTDEELRITYHGNTLCLFPCFQSRDRLHG